MFTWFKKEVENEEIAALNEALGVFKQAADKLGRLRASVQEKYAAHVAEIEALELQKQDLNTIDAKVHNVLLKLKEFI